MDIYDVSQPWLLLRLLWDPLQAELVGSMIPGAGQQSSKSEERKEKGQGSALSMSKPGVSPAVLDLGNLSSRSVCSGCSGPDVGPASTAQSHGVQSQGVQTMCKVLRDSEDTPRTPLRSCTALRTCWARSQGLQKPPSPIHAVYRVSHSKSIRSTRTSSEGTSDLTRSGLLRGLLKRSAILEDGGACLLKAVLLQ